MIKWVLNKYFSKNINQLVDQQLRNSASKKYDGSATQDIKYRIEQLRQEIGNSSPSRVQQQTKNKVQSSSTVQTRRTKPRVQISSNQTSVEEQQRNAELDAMRAKLMGKKT
jgi:hypothetical protein